MRKFVGSAKFGRVRFDDRVSDRNAGRTDQRFCPGEDFDLIITSTHGLTGFKHVLIGSIAEHLVRQSRVPILVVPSHPKVRAANLTGAREAAAKKRPVFSKAAEKLGRS